MTTNRMACIFRWPTSKRPPVITAIRSLLAFNHTLVDRVQHTFAEDRRLRHACICTRRKESYGDFLRLNSFLKPMEVTFWNTTEMASLLSGRSAGRDPGRFCCWWRGFTTFSF